MFDDLGTRGRRADQGAIFDITIIDQGQKIILFRRRQRGKVMAQPHRRSHALEEVNGCAHVITERLAGQRACRCQILPNISVHQDHNLPRRRVIARFGPCCAIEGNVRRQLLQTLPHKIGEHTGPHLACSDIGVSIADDRDIDRHVALFGHGEDLDRGRLTRAVREGDCFAAPQPTERLDLAKHLVAMVAKGRRCQDKVVRMPAGGDREPHAPIG